MLGKINVALKGLLIGASMLVPGVSGGSMAMILSIYDKLIHSINHLVDQLVDSASFLVLFCLGAGVGMILFAKPILVLITLHPFPSMYFFLGAVVGGIPMIAKKAKVSRFDLSSVLWIITGFAIISILATIPTGLISTGDQGILTMIMLIVAGFVAAIALVLPGISVSYMFLVLGLYDTIMASISSLNFTFLIPLAIGLVLGVFVTTKTLEKLMTNYPKATYLLILGFLLGSVIEIFPGIPSGKTLILCAALFTFAAYGVFKISSVE